MKKKTSFSEKIIQQINSARLFPKNYAKTIRSYIAYFKGNIIKYPGITPIMTTEGPKAFEEAAQFLEIQENMPKTCMLNPNNDLENLCKELLQEITNVSNINQMEEVDLNALIEKKGFLKGGSFQVLDFDSELPEFIVAHLIVDDGNKNRTTRNNLFNEKLKTIGVARSEHNSYNNSTLIIAAEEFIDASNTEFNKEEVIKIPTGYNVIRKNCLSKENRKSIIDLVEAMKALELMEEKLGSNDKEIIDICNKFKQDNKFDDEKSSENVVKMTRSEQIIKIDDKDIKVVVINKVYRDGTVSTEKTKEFLN